MCSVFRIVALVAQETRQSVVGQPELFSNKHHDCCFKARFLHERRLRYKHQRGHEGGSSPRQKWSYHRGKLLGIFVAALKQSPDIIGMLVSEVGNADNSHGAEEREMFNELFRDAFRKADGGRSASEHNDIQIFWARGDAAETVMVFRPYVDVEMLGTIYPLRDWRRVEVARPPARTE